MASPDRGSSGRSDPIRELVDEETLADEITKAIAGNDCPDERELVAYVQNELREPERTEVKSHLTFCTRCKKQVQVLVEGAAEQALPSGTARNKSFRGYRLTLQGGKRRRGWLRRVIVLVLVAAAVGAGAYLIWLGSEGEFPYSFKMAWIQGQPPIKAGQSLQLEISTPRPVYLIAITIDCEGHLLSRILPGPRDGKFENLDRVSFIPSNAGEFDLYLVPRPASHGFPDRLLSGILDFLKTDSTVSRVNQRNGVEMALGLYRSRFIHETFRIHP